ncbi:WAT1-related protein At1g43650-like [Triticum dicoccoides]|uniref:WAT1-related protein At1g43650-like n=1 Tax=Triticum dicoccoides TaxID=85692 RepID=UPI001890726C|nr:WAT1-related protein At1g43650-like [Triticum dicoccoides]
MAGHDGDVAVMAVAEDEARRRRRRQAERVALPAGMVLVQVLTVVTMLLSKVALNSGMHPLVLLVYRNLFAAAFVAPLAVVFEREMWKKVNLRVLGWISLNATLGVLLAMGLYYCGLRATSAAYAVNFLNLIPIATFIIAVALRAERLSLVAWASRMKLLGAVVGVAGTMVVTLCKGTHLLLPHLRQSSHANPDVASPHGGRDMAVGTLFLCGSCVSYALWFVVQAKVAKVFPSRYWATALTCAAGSLQSAVAAAVAVVLAPAGDGHGWARTWTLRWDLQLATVVYSGVFNTGVTFVLVSWAVERRGPVYPPMFNSLSLVATTAVDAVVLGTDVYLGGVMGAALVVVGLYEFLWGKSKELAAAKAVNAEQELRCAGDTDDGIA